MKPLEKFLKIRAKELGFDPVGIAPAVSPAGFSHLQEWLQRGMAGEMHYLPRREAAYASPDKVLAGVKSILMAGLNYHVPSGADPSFVRTGEVHVELADCGSAGASPSRSERPPVGHIARYAVGQADYHDVLRERLKQLADVLHEQRPGCRTRTVVDTAPLLERDFARLAGLGWFGKNTMLINRRIGSWFFLGAVLTDVELVPDEPHHTSHCGTCTRCLDACPTDAFAAPYVLDARRCISYLTIELRDDPVPLDLRDGMQDWIFGCDICQEVCPWNRKAPATTLAEFVPQSDVASGADLQWLLSLDDAAFDERFGKTPLERPGRAGLLRNAAIAAGNSGDKLLIPSLERLRNDREPLIRDAVEWAIAKLSR